LFHILFHPAKNPFTIQITTIAAAQTTVKPIATPAMAG
jgi:hypothetical protein